MARIDVIMPQMGESIAEGTLSKWLKQLGDEVKRDEPIFEISTDKVDAEIPAPNAGVLAEILVQQGETVAVNTVVARLETEKGAAVAPSAPAPSAPKPVAPAAKPAPTSEPRPAATPSPRSVVTPAVAPEPSRPAASVADSTGSNGPETAEERLRQKSTPLVRKIAAEHGINIAGVPGSGHAGRVTKNDILGFIEKADRRTGGPVVSGGAGLGPVIEPPSRRGAESVEPWTGDRVEPWSRIRKLTAEHMVMSRRVSAHVQTLFEIDYTRISQIRARRKQEYADRGVNLTYLALSRRRSRRISGSIPVSMPPSGATRRSIGARSTSASRSRSIGGSSFPW